MSNTVLLPGDLIEQLPVNPGLTADYLIEVEAPSVLGVPGISYQATLRQALSISGVNPYLIPISISGDPISGQIVTVPAAIAFQLPLGLPGSVAYCGVTATSNQTFTVSRISGGVTTAVGSFTFAAGQHFATFVAAALISVAAGDIMLITAPNPADATLSNVGINLYGTR